MLLDIDTFSKSCICIYLLLIISLKINSFYKVIWLDLIFKPTQYTTVEVNSFKSSSLCFNLYKLSYLQHEIIYYRRNKSILYGCIEYT